MIYNSKYRNIKIAHNEPGVCEVTFKTKFYKGTIAIRRKETHFANTLIGEVCHAEENFNYQNV